MIQDTSARPIAGAEVELTFISESGSSSTRSDDLGNFELELESVGIALISFRADGFGRIERGPLAVFKPVVLAPQILPPASKMTLRVVGSDGQPIAGAIVGFGSGSSPPRASRATDTATTTEAGRASLWVPSTTTRLFAWAPGVAGATLDSEDLHTTGQRTIRLAGEPPHRLTFLDEKGTPTPGVRVRAASGHWKSDPGGRVDIDSWSPSNHVLDWSAPDGRFGTIEWNGQEVIELPSGVCSAGILVDSETRQPIAGAMIYLEHRPELFTHADRLGRFKLCSMAKAFERAVLKAAAQGYASHSQFLGRSRPPLDLGEIPMVPSVEVSGRVTGAEGGPVAGAEIYVLDTAYVPRTDGKGRPVADADSMSRADGRFDVQGLVPGRRYFFHFFAPGRAAKYSVVTADRGMEPLNIELPRRQILSGSVLSEETEEPIPGAMIVATQAESSGVSPARRAFSNAEGLFSLDGFQAPGGRVRVTAYSGGFALWRQEGISTAQHLLIEMEAGATLEGLVVDASGEPISQAEVAWLNPAPEDLALSHLLSTTTDDAGRFTSNSLPAGEVEIEISHPGYRRVAAALNLQRGNQELTFTLNAAERYPVAGRIVTADSNSLREATISLKPLGGGIVLTSAISESGGFTFAEVEPGRYRSSIKGVGQKLEPSSAEVTVGRGPVEGLELRLLDSSKVHGELIGFSNEELADLGVAASGRERVLGQVDPAERSFEIVDLAPGAWRIEASAAGSSRLAAAVVELRAGESLNADLEARPAFDVRGQVMGGGVPISSISVALNRAEGRHESEARTDSAGTFELRGIREGSYSLELTSGDRLVGRHRIHVDRDRFLDLEIEPSTVEGRVVDHSGEPVLDAEIELRGRGKNAGQRRVARADSEGRFRLEVSPPGSWHLLAAAAGARASEWIEIDEGEARSLEISLVPSNPLRLDVSLDGRAPDRIHAVITGADGRVLHSASHPTGAGGRVEIDDLPPGHWQLAVTTSLGFASPSIPVAVPREEPVLVPLALGGGLEIQVPSLMLDPLPATLELRSQGTSRTLQLQAGHLVIRSLMPGTWNVRIEAENGASWQGEVNVEPGHTTALVVALDPP